jgi:hypothetical protein
VTTPPPTDIRDHLQQLGAALLARNFKVKIDDRQGLLIAKNPAVMATDDPIGRAMSPGLAQTVALGTHNGGLFWFWQWSGATRDAAPEHELLGPAEQIGTTADKIAYVLRLVDEPARQ